MTALVDLSHPLADGMPVYPGDPPVVVRPGLTLAADGVNVCALGLGSHTGTHVDAPAHVLADAPSLDEVPLERFRGPLVLLDARGLAPAAEIGPDLLRALPAAVDAALVPGAVAVVVTGWSTYWGTDAYADHPYLSVELANALLGRGIRTVGVDTFSPDATPGDGTLPVHLVLAAAGAVIAENLAGPQRLLAAQDAGARLRVDLMPLRIARGDGSPVRAVATVEES